jgi:hypothetical protein
MSHKITEKSMDMEVRQTITAYYSKDVYKRIDMVVNPAKMRVRFDVFDDIKFMSENKPAYSGQSLKHAIKIYNEVGND